MGLIFMKTVIGVVMTMVGDNWAELLDEITVLGHLSKFYESFPSPRLEAPIKMKKNENAYGGWDDDQSVI